MKHLKLNVPKQKKKTLKLQCRDNNFGYCVDLLTKIKMKLSKT